jgi:hypothetical protein
MSLALIVSGKVETPDQLGADSLWRERHMLT